jgi:hypothetical protein
MKDIIEIPFGEIHTKEALSKLQFPWMKVLQINGGIRIEPIYDPATAESEGTYYPTKAFIEDRDYRSFFLDIENNAAPLAARAYSDSPQLNDVNVSYHLASLDLEENFARFKMPPLVSNWCVVLQSIPGYVKIIFDRDKDTAEARAKEIIRCCFRVSGWEIGQSWPLDEMELRWGNPNIKQEKEEKSYSIEQITKLVRVIRPDMVKDLNLIKTILEN